MKEVRFRNPKFKALETNYIPQPFLHITISLSHTPNQTKPKMPPKHKQQTISRFFAPKPKPTDQPQIPGPSSPKTATTVSFSPAKRKLLSSHLISKKPRPLKLPEPSPTSQNPQTTTQTYTPLEHQVLDLKKKYPDVLLMIEVGYKFRFFGQDAEIAAKVLGIYAHVDRNFVTASIPCFRLNVHVRRLVTAGFKVGVVKQTETAAIKASGESKMGLFCRDLSALYTKATMEACEDGGGEGFCGESNYLCCVVEKCDEGSEGFDVRIGFVGVEISTGDVVFGEFKDVFLRSGLEALLLNLVPVELILAKPLSKQTEKLLLAYAGPASNVRIECASCDCFDDGGALAELLSVYEDIRSEVFVDGGEEIEEGVKHGNHQLAIGEIMNMPELAVQALALIIRHLKQFGLERILCIGASFRPFKSNIEMSLSANTLQQLEILRNNSNGSESGSLLHIIKHTLTIYGSRLLRHWVTHPLCDRNMISARLDAVSEIAESMTSLKASQNITEMDEGDIDVTTTQPDFYHLLNSVLTALGRSPDIERGLTRIFHRTATASEFIVVVQAILSAGKKLQQLQIKDQNYGLVGAQIVQSALLKKLILTASSPSIVGIAAKLLSSLNKEAADRQDLPNLIYTSTGQFPEVARAQKEVQLVKEKLDSLISLYRKQLSGRNIEFISVAGITHLIELPVDVKVPLNWVKVNSTKKTVRYHPPEVLTSLGQLSLETEKLKVACRNAWDSFLGGFGKYYAEFRAAIQALAGLDCLHSLATLSKNENYNRPVFVDGNEPVQIIIRCGRHPVLETILQDNFVPNDTNLHTSREFCQIITGPNMGGKSCYIRQVALIAIMAQVGSFVPAKSAKLHVLDGIFTRMGASDSIQQGRSTFLEELSEASHILHRCTSRSLVIIDELGRGTSTHDGGAIAYATLHHLLDQKKCMVLFVTHYPKIADIRAEFPRSVGAYHVSYITSDVDKEAKDSEYDNEDVTYLYKLVPGVSEKSFGFKVAQLAQIPPSCIRCATVMAERLEAIMSSRMKAKADQKQSPAMLPIKQEQETRKDISKSPIDFETMSDARDLSNSCEQFFSNLKFAIADDNPAKALHFLKSAQTIAEEILASHS